MNEVEHVALVAAAGAKAVEDLFIKVDRAGGLPIVMEGAADLELHSPARCEAVVDEDIAEVRACLDRIEVNTTVTVHLYLPEQSCPDSSFDCGREIVKCS